MTKKFVSARGGEDAFRTKKKTEEEDMYTKIKR